jgi:hypothetical protein
VDTNVFNSASNEVSDTSVVITPSLDALLPVGKTLWLSADGYVDFNYFRRETSERSTDLSGNFRAEVDVGPLTLFAGIGAGRYKQRFSIEIDERDERLERHEERFLGGVVLRATDKLALTADGSQRTSTYASGVLVGGDDVKTSLDRRTRMGTMRVSYALTDQTTFSAFARVHQDHFLSEPDPAFQNVRSYTYAAGFDFGERAVINGSLIGGLRYFPDDADQGAPPFHGPYADVRVSSSLGDRVRLSVTAIRDVFYAVTRAETFKGSSRNSYVSSLVRGELNVELPYRLIGRGSVGYERASYLLAYEQNGLPFDRVDQVNTWGAGLLRAFGRAVRIGVTGQWSRRTSNLEGFGYSGLRWGLTAEVVP